MTFKTIALIELALNVVFMFFKYRSDKAHRKNRIKAAKDNFDQNIRIHNLHEENHVKLKKKLEDDLKEADKRYREFRKRAKFDNSKNRHK